MIFGPPRATYYVPTRLRWNKHRIKKEMTKLYQSLSVTIGKLQLKAKTKQNRQSTASKAERTSWFPQWIRKTRIVSMVMCCFMALNNKHQDYDNDLFANESFDIAIDTACSYCITNDARQFIGKPEKINIEIKGIGGKEIRATMRGTVEWSFTNDTGQVHTEIITNAHYHSASPFCLYSPQHVAQIRNDHHPRKFGTYCGFHDKAAVIMWEQRQQRRTVPIHPKLNIFIMRSSPTFHRFASFCSAIEEIDNDQYDISNPAIQAYLSGVVSDEEDDGDDADSIGSRAKHGEDHLDCGSQQTRRHPDLPDNVFDVTPFDGKVHIIPTEDTEIQSGTPQSQLLAWHYRLGHIPFRRIRHMAARGDLPASLLTCPTPKCAACMYGKATRRAWRTRAPVNAMTTPAVTGPGSVVGVDQMVSAVPGLIAQMKGFLTFQRYTVATVFVDHFSDLSYVYLQKGSTALETVEAKRAFERYAKLHGVVVKHYHADNGIFEAREFRQALVKDGQSITYCGVNAHHQNGKAEKKIRDLQELARTMLLHAQYRWPQAIDAHLWPFAIKMANDTSNRAPGIKSGISPLEVFSQVEVKPKVTHAHTFGAPVYVLDNELQVQGATIPKWDQRTDVGIYVGISPRHSRKVALVLNLTTGHVSPQFHILIDDYFETLRPTAGNPIPESKWQQVTGFTRLRKGRKEKPTVRTPVVEPQIPSFEQLWEEDPFRMPEIADSDGAETNEGTVGNVLEPPENVLDERPTDRSPEIPRVETRAPQTSFGQPSRSGRVPKLTTRMLESQQQQEQGIVSLFVEWELYHDESYAIQDSMESPMAFVASSNPDVMYMDQALREPDSKQFEAAMIQEVTSHTEKEHWVIVPKTEVPKDVDILPSVWAMRRKRRIATGEPYKWKARLNVHGGHQTHGVNFWETYAPVIGWTTIRLYLLLAILNKRATRQIDFVLAFPQAEIECDLYMEIPKGFKFQGSRETHCLLLKKNLYGQKQAGRVWNEYLHNGLLARGFVQSKVDMCLYYHKLKNVNLLIYTDDGILTAECDADIEYIIKLLKSPINGSRPFDITDEGTLNDYLGVKVEHLDDGSIKLSQPHLIDQIIKDIGFSDNTKAKSTPAESTVKLHRDVHGLPRQEDWHYRSIVGKLNFLEKSTRPDIAYAVHQAARFANDPKQSHENAVKRIVRFLVGTRTDGIHLRPNGHSFDCWVDADFVGNWDRVNADVDPSTAKSRTGFMIMYGGCPLSWASKLQTDVALSTTEAEYTALSTSLREVIHLMQLVEEASELGWVTAQDVPNIHCSVFEDNVGALEMARLPKMRPRTKHLCTRMHHFREKVRQKKISIHHIDTDLQIADMLTKPQPEKLYLEQRPKLLRIDPRDIPCTSSSEGVRHSSGKSA